MTASAGHGPAAPDPIDWLQDLVDHQVSSVGVSAGSVAGLSLDAPRRVYEALGLSDDGVRVIHVTGTNGKGSVCRMIERLIDAEGLRAGTYLSPEGTVEERIRIDGRPVDTDELRDAVTAVRGTAETLGVALTAFEAVTLSALVAFSDAPVDVAIVEVGLLGRYDATNVVDADVAVVTAIGPDHTDFRPGWEVAVATEKAGIIGPRSALVLGDIDPGLHEVFVLEGPASMTVYDTDFEVIDTRVAMGGSIVEFTTSRGGRYQVPLSAHGAHQAHNLAVAVEAVEALVDRPLDPDVVEVAAAGVELPGRLEVVRAEPLVVIDGAHNTDAAAALGVGLDQSFTVLGRRMLVYATLAGRDPRAFLDALLERFGFDVVYLAGTEGPRGVAVEDLASAVGELDPAVVLAPTLSAATTRAFDDATDDDLVLITGSFSVVDPARKLARDTGDAPHR